MRTDPALVRAPFLAAAAMLFVGSSAGASALLRDYPVDGGQAVRYAVAAAGLLLITALRRLPLLRPTRREAVLIVALAAVGLTAFSSFQLAAVRHASPAVVGTVLGTLPVVLALVWPLANRRRPAGRVLVAALVVSAGAILATGLGHTDVLGVVYSLGLLACEVGFSLLAVPVLRRHGPLRTSAYSTAVAAVLFALLGVVTGPLLGRPYPIRVPEPAELGALAYVAFVVTVGAFLCWYDAMPRLGPDRAGLFAGLVPVGAIVTGVLVGTGLPSLAELAGAVVVAVGVVGGTLASAASARLVPWTRRAQQTVPRTPSRVSRVSRRSTR